MTSVIVQTNGIVKELNVQGKESGSLQGMKFVAKDLFDVKGEVTGAGNRDWKRTHVAASKTADAISAMLDAGASLVGKACTDELAFSIDGINFHYGAPLNPQYPDRVTGGSSSGSASAVAAKLVDFALGTDTAGSIRVPASYCGIFGFRPTHGRVSINGTVPLAPAFDTVGWLARDPHMLRICGTTLLNESDTNSRPRKILIAKDAFECVDERLKQALFSAVEATKQRFEIAGSIELEGLGWSDYAQHLRIMQGWQAWQCHGDWYTRTQPVMGQAIKDRFDFAKSVTKEQYDTSCAFRAKVIDDFDELLADGTVLCIPTTWNLPPMLSATNDELISNRNNTIKLTSIASLASLPQVSIPVRLTESTTTGLSFLAARNKDSLLLNLYQKV